MTAPYPGRTAEARDAGATDGGYTSPIPVRQAHLGDAIVAEWTKIRSVRSTMWTLGVLVLLVLGTGVLIAWGVAATAPRQNPGQVLAYGIFGVLLGNICVITLGVLTFSSEFSTGLIRTTLTACPSRARVLAAKTLVYFTVVFTLTLVLTLITAVLQVVILDTPSPAGSQWVSATLGVSVYVALLGVLSQALGVVVKHAAGAVTAMLGVVMLPLVVALFLSTTLPAASSGLLVYSIPSQLASFYPYIGGVVSGSGPTAWDSLWILIGATAIAMGGAYVALDRRDA